MATLGKLADVVVTAEVSPGRRDEVMTDRNCVLGTYRFFGVADGDCVLWDRCVDCLDDDEARATASTFAGVGMAIEVWDVARFVARCPRSSGLAASSIT